MPRSRVVGLVESVVMALSSARDSPVRSSFLRLNNVRMDRVAAVSGVYMIEIQGSLVSERCYRMLNRVNTRKRTFEIKK